MGLVHLIHGRSGKWQFRPDGSTLMCHYGWRPRDLYEVIAPEEVVPEYSYYSVYYRASHLQIGVAGDDPVGLEGLASVGFDQVL